MSTNQERDAIKRLDPSKAWAEEVDRMRNDQIAAIYCRLQAMGKLRK